MSETLDPSKSFRHRRTRTAKILGLGLILAAIGSIVYVMTESAGRDATPTVYHHPDGTFTLNRKDGPSITPEDVYECLRGYERFGRVRLVSNPLTQLVDWNNIVSKASESGAANYQIEAEGMSFSFTLPCMDGYTGGPMNPSATIINLAEMPEPPLDLYPGSDVVILVKFTTTCDEALKVASDHLGKGKSITILSGSENPDPYSPDFPPVLLHHRKDHDGNSIGEFVKRRSGFWNKHIQPSIDRLKSVF
jgi:hypothetical protein